MKMEEILIDETGTSKWDLYLKRTIDRLIGLKEYKLKLEKLKRNTFLTDMSIDINEQLVVVLSAKIKELR